MTDLERLLDFVKIYNYETGYQIEYFEAISAEDKSDYQTFDMKLLHILTSIPWLKEAFLQDKTYADWQGDNRAAVRAAYQNIVSEIS